MKKYFERKLKAMEYMGNFYSAMCINCPDKQIEFFDNLAMQWARKLVKYIQKGRNKRRKGRLYNKMDKNGAFRSLKEEAEKKALRRTKGTQHTRNVLYGMGISIVKNPGDTLFVEGPNREDTR